ncbi:MAG: hypothetical protein IPL49_12595 [Saprospirales bacterium]|nr:hypothetical protein [Saprospirales bacterium]MBK8491689.1 hypothetical protein [Saprospirales bacterium]
MKALKTICTALVLLMPLFMAAQESLVGNWTTSVPAGEDGSVIPLKVTMTDAGTYTLDFGADGQVEVSGKYIVDGNQVVIMDEEGGECKGQRGIYTFTADATSLMMVRTQDACEGRGGPEGKMRFTREK